jgi:DMSO/TMAO reductase YedYZ heme-binding membrane subunit
MFIGVLPKTALVQRLYSIRTEMSVIGATILAGHALLQLSYNYFLTAVDKYEFFVYWIMGSIISALLLLPWITSFRVIRKKMKAGTWKKLQTYLGVPLFIYSGSFIRALR